MYFCKEYQHRRDKVKKERIEDKVYNRIIMNIKHKKMWDEMDPTVFPVSSPQSSVRWSVDPL